LEKANEWTQEYSKLCKLRQIQQIVRSPPFDSIVQTEKELTDIELTEEELGIIGMIKSDVTIAQIIKFEGINLYFGSY